MFFTIAPYIEALLAFFTITLISSLISAFSYRYCYALIQHFSGASRAAAIFIYALLAPVVGLWSTTLLVFPSLSTLIIPEHCHDGVCSSHSPSVALHSVIGGGFAILSTLIIITLILTFYFNLQRYQQQLTTLDKLSNVVSDTNYKIIDNPTLVAWNAGLWRTKIFISQGLKSALTTDELNVVVAHEVCHGFQHDNLRKLILLWLSKVWLTNKAQLRYDFNLACEQACDLYAANEVSSSTQVINTIEKYAGLAKEPTITNSYAKQNTTQTNQKSAVHGYDGEEVRQRINFLNHPIKQSNKSITLMIVCGLLFSQVVIFTMIYHLGLDHFWLS
ncbi:M56 family metallopeptidase [Colwellia echini]|uniref:M56 family metallopeptidase n=1 Tax=Colwellia echini TaxID=1982103 RepID=A0ABY3MUV1_9GAMM|nr:M56 family metallopeptidase [Colwellia echini]TYK64993.1 M56 family metallopeptidase [Colwellia echini]